MKYRLLTIDELNELEKEFIEFLVINGVTADDWEKIKATDIQKADKFIELFSDTVFEGVMRKVKYLDFRSEKLLQSFQCLAEKIVMVGIQLDEKSNVNLLDLKSFTQFKNNPSGDVKVITSEKSYNDMREVELFRLIQRGCEISDGTLFKTLCLAL